MMEHVSITSAVVTACTAMSLVFDCLGVVLELNVRQTIIIGGGFELL